MLPNRDVAVPIINATYEVKLREVPLATEIKGETDLIDVIAQLRTLVGAARDAAKEQLQVEARFLQNNYADLSVEDVKIAFNLYMSNRLDIETQSYVIFSPLFIAHVLNSYRVYRSKTIKAVGDKAEPKLMMYEEEIKNNSDEGRAKKLEGIKECIRECCRHEQEGFRERFFIGMVYDFLKKTKRLRIDDALRKEAKEFAEKKFLLDREANWKMERSKLDNIVHISETIYSNPAALYDNKNDALADYMREFYLTGYFNKIGLNDLLNSITEKDLI
jgi:hypothetical protein